MKHARRAFHFSLPLLFVAVGIMAVLAFSSQTLLGYLTQSATINKVQEVDTNAAGMTQAQTTAAKKLNTAAAAAESARTNTERQNTTLDLLVAGQTYENLTYSAAGRPAATTYEQARQEAIQTLSGNSPNAGGYITTDSNGNPTGLTEKAISSLITNVPTTTPSNSSTSTTGRDCSVTCATQGAPVCKGDYVFTGGGLDESGGAYHGAGSAPRRECTMCLGDEKKTFDGSYDCGKLVADGKPVIMAPDVDPASIGLPKTYINANGQEVAVVTNPCFENIGGTYRQVPFGQADSKGNICGMNGAYVAQDTFNKDMNSVCSSAGKIYDAAKKQCVTKPTTPTTPTTQSGSAGANNGTSAGAPVAGTTPIKCGPGFVVDQSNSQFCKPMVSGDAVDRYAKSCTDKGSNYVYNYQTGICSTKSAAVSSPVRTLSCGLQSNGSYVSCGTGSSGTNVIHFCPTGKVWTVMGCQPVQANVKVVNETGIYTGGESTTNPAQCKYGSTVGRPGSVTCNYPNGKSKPDLVPVSFGSSNQASAINLSTEQTNMLQDRTQAWSADNPIFTTDKKNCPQNSTVTQVSAGGMGVAARYKCTPTQATDTSLSRTNNSSQDYSNITNIENAGSSCAPTKTSGTTKPKCSDYCPDFNGDGTGEYEYGSGGSGKCASAPVAADEPEPVEQNTTNQEPLPACGPSVPLPCKNSVGGIISVGLQVSSDSGCGANKALKVPGKDFYVCADASGKVPADYVYADAFNDSQISSQNANGSQAHSTLLPAGSECSNFWFIPRNDMCESNSCIWVNMTSVSNRSSKHGLYCADKYGNVPL